MTPAEAIFVMGVSGIGKSTVGSALAATLGMTFIDADDLHPGENKAKMGAGIPLTDEDRWPWLDAVALAARCQPSVIACSALRRRYRERLLALVSGSVFVHLDADSNDIARRLAGRTHEYMPASQLESQLATLEPLEPDEPGFRIDAGRPVGDLVRQVVDELQGRRNRRAAGAAGSAPRPTPPALSPPIPGMNPPSE